MLANLQVKVMKGTDTVRVRPSDAQAVITVVFMWSQRDPGFTCTFAGGLFFCAGGVAAGRWRGATAFGEAPALPGLFHHFSPLTTPFSL